MIYAVNRGERPMGSFSREDVLRGVNEGRFTKTDFIWLNEEQRWTPLFDFFRRSGTQFLVPQCFWETKRQLLF